jgi:hypothetical protein
MRGPVLLLTLVLAAATAQAQIYRWVDAQGRVQMGDRPPPGVDAKLVAERSQTHKPVNAEAERQRLQQQQDRWQQSLRPPVAPVPARVPEQRLQRPAVNADPCARARYRFEGARDGRLNYCRDDDCERVDANDLALLEREMKEACQRR